MAATHRWLKPLRTLHLYFGVFTAPALLFFAFTGALQSVPLHEASRGSDYKPPAWLVSIAHLHKKQTLDAPAKRARPKPAGTGIAAGCLVYQFIERPLQRAVRHRPVWLGGLPAPAPGG